MTINFILNGEDVEIQTEAGYRLADIIRGSFGLLRTRTCCNTGLCGACSIILDGNVVKSCLIPAFKIQDREIVTIEGFSQTDEYLDIEQGFSEANVKNCGFCNTGKILAAEALLNRIPQPSREEILSAFSGIRCRCTEPEELVRGIMAVTEYRKRRLYGRSS